MHTYACSFAIQLHSQDIHVSDTKIVHENKGIVNEIVKCAFA